MATQKFLTGGKEPLTFSGTFAENGVGGGNSFSVNNRNVLITVVGTGTVVVHGSGQFANKEIDFSAASTIDNSHAEIVMADYSVTGGAKYVTSAVVAGTTKVLELNTNLLTQVGIQRTVGTPDVLITIADNQ